jgi:hypothetical protein
MSPTGIVATVLLAILLLVATTQIGLFWRNNDPRRRLEEPQSWWPYGRSHWLRFLRCWPLALLGGWLLVLTAALLTVAPTLFRPPIDYTIVALFAVVIALGFGAYIFGQPSFVVPPWLRQKPH